MARERRERKKKRIREYSCETHSMSTRFERAMIRVCVVDELTLMSLSSTLPLLSPSLSSLHIFDVN